MVCSSTPPPTPPPTRPHREHRPFRNSARQDSLQLAHWVKLVDPDRGTSCPPSPPHPAHPPPEYPFAKYNVQPKPYNYSQDEYTRLLEGSSPQLPPPRVSRPSTDNEWTKEETDYLFKIVQEYDLRWYVIHDRYDYPDGPVRVIEVPFPHPAPHHTLTSRNRTSRTATTASVASSSGIGHGPATSPVNHSSSTLTSSTKVPPSSPPRPISPKSHPEREKMRKNYIASLEDRTPEEIAEEEALFIELKRLEQNERKFRQERDELLRTLLGVDSGLPDIAVEEDGPSALSIEGIKKKKKGAPADSDLPPTPSNIIQLGLPITKKAPSATSAIYGEIHPSTPSLQLTQSQMRNIASFG